MVTSGVDDERFPSEDQLRRWCERVCGAGYRGTATEAHEEVLRWVEAELRAIPGVEVRSDEIEVLRWRPVPEGDLEAAGGLRVDDRDVPVAGAVPYSAPGERSGPLVRLAAGAPITAATAGGRVLLVDFPHLPLPYDLLLGLGFHTTPGCDELRGTTWDRPGLADGILHDVLLAAGAAGAAGVVIAFDLPREQVAAYFEPHKGTHHHVPAVFVGVDERERLREAAVDGMPATVSVRAEVERATTRNVHATLPGTGDERIVLVTHTDGNTWVQENGVAALLALAHHFAGAPPEERHRTIELALTTAHLHISKEGSARYAEELDAAYDDGTVAFVFAVEHLGVREIEPTAREDGPGRQLEPTGAEELVLWSVGPSEALRRTVTEAVERRDLGRVLLAPGLGAPVAGQVPEVVSFGGLGTHFHLHLVPTTSIITGPWSLWAPSFGESAVDVALMRRQALAAADVVAALDGVPRDVIAGGYLDDRRARAAGAPVGSEPLPPEVAPR